MRAYFIASRSGQRPALCRKIRVPTLLLCASASVERAPTLVGCARVAFEGAPATGSRAPLWLSRATVARRRSFVKGPG